MLMQIDGTFIFVVISFLIFLVIIKAVLYAPISRIIDERQKFYAKNSKMELTSKEKSKKLVDEKEEAINSSKSEASEIIKETSRKAHEESETIIKETKKEIQEKIEENKNNLENARNASKCELKNEISSFVSMLTSKILNEEVHVEIDEEKIKGYLNI